MAVTLAGLYANNLHVDDDDWVKKCIPRGRPKRIWKEVVRENCQARKLNKEDAADHCKWRKVIKEVRWPGWVWAGECFFWYRPTRVVPDKRPLNGCCCCCMSLQRDNHVRISSLQFLWLGALTDAQRTVLEGKSSRRQKTQQRRPSHTCFHSWRYGR